MPEVRGDYYDWSIKKNLFQRFWHKRRFLEVKNILNCPRIEKILDVGCHGGRFIYEISKQFPTASIFGIDSSQTAIQYAIKKYPDFHFQIAQAERLPFKDNFFDLVTCLEVLEHVKNPRQVLEEIKRVLKRKGILVILVPSENYLFKLGWFFWVRFGPGRVWQNAHINEFRNNILDSLLRQLGFQVLERKSFLLEMLLLIKAKKN